MVYCLMGCEFGPNCSHMLCLEEIYYDIISTAIVFYCLFSEDYEVN